MLVVRLGNETTVSGADGRSAEKVSTELLGTGNGARRGQIGRDLARPWTEIWLALEEACPPCLTARLGAAPSLSPPSPPLPPPPLPQPASRSPHRAATPEVLARFRTSR